MKVIYFVGALLMLVACNFQDNNYYPVDLNMSQYADAKTGSWWKYRDSLGTATDSVVVTSLTNTFEPLPNGSEKELYQTIVMSMIHFPSLKNSQVIVSRNQETSTLSYTDTTGNTFLLLTTPSTNEPTLLRTITSGTRTFSEVMEFDDLRQAEDTLFIAKGYWIVKHTIKLGEDEQNWIVDTLAIK